MSTNVFFLSSLVFQSGCKTKTSFCFSQEKFNKILKLFFHFLLFNSPSNLSMNFRVLRGANVKSIFKSHKLFWIFFSDYFSESDSRLSVFQWTLIAVAGAKVDNNSSSASFFKSFFYSFFRLFLNTLITPILQNIFFQSSVGFFNFSLWFLYFLCLFDSLFYQFSSFYDRFWRRIVNYKNAL